MNDYYRIEFAEPVKSKFQHNWFLAISLFIITFFSTTIMGVIWVGDLKPALTTKEFLFQLISFKVLFQGLKFSIPCLFILLCHELGHYLACRYYMIDATLPFFIPAPFGIGTLGAFIKIKEPFPSKRALFDVAICGPISGFLASIPFAVIGIINSKVIEHIPAPGEFYFQDPLLFKIIIYLKFKELGPNETIILNPFIFASWIGLFATMLNLLPFGQLDGGHIVYSVFGRYQRRIVFPLYVGLLFLGIEWTGWFLWAIIIIIMSPFHPRLWDENLPIDRKRKIISIFVLLIFILSFMPVPLKIL